MLTKDAAPQRLSDPTKAPANYIVDGISSDIRPYEEKKLIQWNRGLICGFFLLLLMTSVGVTFAVTKASNASESATPKTNPGKLTGEMPSFLANMNEGGGMPSFLTVQENVEWPIWPLGPLFIVQFEFADADKSGDLDASEFSQALQMTGLEAWDMDRLIAKLMEHADVDRNDRLSLNEFMSIMVEVVKSME